jgi:hypothetical protein
MEGARASRWSAINRIGDTTKLTLDTEWPSHGSRDRQGAVPYAHICNACALDLVLRRKPGLRRQRGIAAKTRKNGA